MFEKKFGLNDSPGDATTQYRGDFPTSSNDFIKRFFTDNHIIKEGLITEVFMGGYVAQVTFGNGVAYGVWLNDILGGFSGTNKITIPSAGSKVLVLKYPGIPAIILGALPHEEGNDDSIPFMVEDGGKDFFTEDQHNVLKNQDGLPQFMESFNAGRPVDAFPGEWGIINELGNIMALMKGMALLKATDLAQLQLHSIDDLVRIVSKTFEHISSLGDDHIFDDHGKVSREIRYCTKLHDTFGVDDDQQISKEGEVRSYVPDDPQEIADKIRIHIGHLGNLFRAFFLNSDRDALSEIHLKDTGSINVNSAKDIFLRKANDIKAPERKKKYYETTEEDTEESIDPFEYSDGAREPQDNDRTTWENTKYNNQNYSEDVWNIESPSSSENESYIGQRDDGSIILKDAAGSCIELDGKGKIIITCKADIELRAGEETTILSGKNINVRAQDNLDVCCTEGDVRIKAEEAFQLFTRNKGVLIETDSSDVPDGGVAELHNYSGIKLVTNEDTPITLDSGQNVNVYSDDNTIIHAKNEARIESKEKINIATGALSCFGVTPVAPDDFESTPAAPLSLINLRTTQFSIWSSNMAILCDLAFQVAAQTISLSGTLDTTIFSGAPTGTNVNHQHTLGVDYTYVPDSAGGEVISPLINKIGVPVPVVITPETNISTDALMTPFLKSVIDLTTFSFRSQVYTGNVWEYLWQKDASNFWNMISKDTFQSTTPFPGYSYSLYGIYTSTNGETNIGGSFNFGSINQYKT